MSVADGTILRIVASILMPDSVVAQNIFYAVLTGGTPPWDDQDIVDDAAAYMENIYSEWEALAFDECSLNLIQVYYYDAIDGDWDELGALAGASDGINANDMLPHGVAAYTQARTTDPDVTAAKYWTGLTEESQADGAFSGATLTSLIALVERWILGQTGITSDADFTAGVWSVAGSVFKALNGDYTINAVPGYQRRRKPGVGS